MSHEDRATVPLVIRVQEAFLARPDNQRTWAPPIRARVGETQLDLRVGDNQVPLPPGQWTVAVWIAYYGMKAGKAQLTVDTRPGRPLLLHYMPPRTLYNRGVLGHEPVTERPGRNTMLLIYALVVGIGLLGAAIAIPLLR